MLKKNTIKACLFKSYLYNKILSLCAIQHAYLKVENIIKYCCYVLFKKISNQFIF